MAVASRSLASQLSGPKTLNYARNFSGLWRSCSKLENFQSMSSTQSLFQHLHSHLHLSSSRKGFRGVVNMAGTGKFFVGGNWKCKEIGFFRKCISIQTAMGLQKDTESIQRARIDDCGEVIVDSYNLWLKKHPSALDNFDEMMKLAEGKKVVVFLDYDGTLSEIVTDPDRATMTPNMREAVKNVALHFPTAIISGRARDKVFQFVKLHEVYYAGSHGMDISGSSKYGSQTITNSEKKVEDFCPAKEFLPTIQKIVMMLRDKTKHIKGAIVEDNKFCLSVHFRCVEDRDVCDLKSMVKNMMECYQNFKISEGKKVMEIRPDIEWDKGRALLYLLRTLGFGNSNDVVPIYIGDDKTDEDAFKVIQSRGEDQGLAIVVSSTAKETEASYSLREPNQVKCFLKRLVKWKQDLQPSI